jgi:transcription antitermination factor NusG
VRAGELQITQFPDRQLDASMLKLADNPPCLADGLETIHQFDGPLWVAHTKARAEKALAWDLLSLDIQYFLPMAEKLAIWGGRKRKILSPIFPSYLFFCGDLPKRHRVLATNRVCQVIAVHDRPQLMQELEAIRIALNSGRPMDLYPFAAVGQPVRVARGPMRGVEGLVIRKDDVTRIVLQVSMLGQGVSLEISADMLEPA